MEENETTTEPVVLKTMEDVVRFIQTKIPRAKPFAAGEKIPFENREMVVLKDKIFQVHSNNGRKLVLSAIKL